MTKSATVFGLVALVLLAGCGSTGRGLEKATSSTPTEKGVDEAARIVPVIDPGARKAALAALPANERDRYCRKYSVRAATLSEEASISGPVRRQRSNAQMAGNAILETVEGWYAGNTLATGIHSQRARARRRNGGLHENPAIFPG